jgi:putative oxygen-independent coproporphyrinogen III oxidase
LSEPAVAGRPIGLYIHWPFCARICPYCDFNVVRDRGVHAGGDLVRAVMADLRAQASRVGRRRLVSMFFGGGTPSLMGPAQAAAIVDESFSLFDPACDLEITLEANPTDAEAARFSDFRAAGVTRLSLGVQSLDDAALKFLGRNHDAAAARRAAELASAIFPRLSIDLIYALPGQSSAAWRAQIAGALALGAEHISAYQLTIEPGTAFANQVARARWTPAPDEHAAELYEITDEVMGEAGFSAYEISNHARGEAARSRHNLNYWRSGDWLGVGPGAHGRITDGCGRRWATSAVKDLRAYAERVVHLGCGVESSEPLTPREAALEALIMGLRTVEGVAREAIATIGVDPARLARLADQGLLDVDARRIAVTRKGRLLLDRILLDLTGGETRADLGDRVAPSAA